MDTLLKLTNPEFSIEFSGNEYKVKKANLEMLALYHKRVKELSDSKDPASDVKLVAYAIYLILNKVNSSITEDIVLQNVPADIEIFDCLVKLGFMNPNKKMIAEKVQGVLQKNPTSESSLSS